MPVYILRALVSLPRLALALAACTVVAWISTASTAAQPAPHSSKAQGHPHTRGRVGGRVHRAWPHGAGRAPKSALARWLARQVGPTQALPCQRRVKRHTVQCHRAKPPHRGVVLPGTSGDLGATPRAGPDGAIASAASVSTGSSTLQLVRSYGIPTDDPSYARLLNWSWTYDSGITAVAFTVSGYSSQAQQLLDQLAALQHTNGSIEIAFNVANGTAEPVFRSGTIATVGLAGSLYDQYFHSTRYLAMEERAGTYLLSRQGTGGLVGGGPDVSWYSTQHNLLAYAFFVVLGNELIASGAATSALTYWSAASRIASGIESNLLVRSGSTAYFIEGLGDNVQSLDADALGAMYLESRGEGSLAQQVATYAQGGFAVTGRSIVHSSEPSTYNTTYAAKGPFSGFKPYLGTSAPNVLWTEGSAEMLLTLQTLRQSTTALSQSLNAIAAITPSDAPLQSDQTATSIPYGAEYHVWPAAAAGAWMLLAGHQPAAALFNSEG
jgi:hypothetical protein